MTELVSVPVPCSTGTHPDGDAVLLRPKLGLAGGIAAEQTVREIGSGTPVHDVEGVLLEVYVRHGIAEWTLHDDAGKAIPLNSDTLQQYILDDFTIARPIGMKADDLYSAAVVTPLVNAVAKSLRASQAARSTSASRASSASPRKRSKRSSTSTTPMDATATTSPSPAGDSSS